MSVNENNNTNKNENNNYNLQKRLFERDTNQNKNGYNFQSNLFKERLKLAKNLYKFDLVAHYGCVNAIEFSNGGEFLISGGDDKRVLLWNVEKSISGYEEPRAMEKEHQSNIFCLNFNNDNTKIFSGGNDDLVIVHDTETGKVVDVYIHSKPVYGLSVDPCCDNIISTAGEDGRVLLFDQRKGTAILSIGKYRAPFHAVQFHPLDGNFLVTANSKKGAAFWDIRKAQSPVIQYGGEGNQQSCMSVRFNTSGNQILALRRRLPPVLYNTFSHKAVCQFYHPDYYNSCTMKSCSFAGEDDEFVLSGSDDFNLYVWRVGDINLDLTDQWIEQTQMVLYGHRSIVNQVRYNPQKCLLASSGVEKIVKLWCPFQQKGWVGSLTEEATGPENPREVFSHDDYFSLLHMNWSNMTHDYSNQNTHEDPRMMAFFDSLIQQEIEGWNTNNSSDSDQCSVGTSENSTRQSSTESSDEDVVNYVVHSRDRNRRGNLNSTVKPQRNKYANRIAYLIATKRNTLRRLALKGASQTSRQRHNTIKNPKRKNHTNRHSNLRTSRSGSNSAKRVGRFNSLTNRSRTREENDQQKNNRFKTQHQTSLFRSLRRKGKHRVYDRPETSSDDNSSHSGAEGVGDNRQTENNTTGGGFSATISIAIPSTSTGITSNGNDIIFRLRQQQDDSDADESPLNTDHEDTNANRSSNISPKVTINGLNKNKTTTTATSTTNSSSTSSTAATTPTSTITAVAAAANNSNNNDNNNDTNHDVQSSDIDEDRCLSPINRRKRPTTSTTVVGDLDIYSSHSNSRLSNSSYLEDERDSSSNESLDCFSKKRKIVPSSSNSNNNNNINSNINNISNNNINNINISDNNFVETNSIYNKNLNNNNKNNINSSISIGETSSSLSKNNNNNNNNDDVSNTEIMNNNNNNNNDNTNEPTTPTPPMTEIKTPNHNLKMNNYKLINTPDSGISVSTTPGYPSSSSSSSYSSFSLSSLSSSSSSNCNNNNNNNDIMNCYNNNNNNNINYNSHNHNNNNINNCSSNNLNSNNNNNACSSITGSGSNNCNNDKFSIKLFHQKIARVRKSYRKKFGDDSDSD